MTRWSHHWKQVTELGRSLVYVSAFYIICTTLFIEGYQIPTGSMEPTLHGARQGGDRIFAIKAIYRLWPLRRGDIVIFISPEDNSTRLVKRLIGLPGDRLEIKDGQVWINGKKLREPEVISRFYYYNVNVYETNGKYYGLEGQVIKVPAGHYYMLGDNSIRSKDSRYWGFVPQANIIGKALCIYWPFRRMGILE